MSLSFPFLQLRFLSYPGTKRKEGAAIAASRPTHRPESKRRLLRRWLGIAIGAILVAVGLEIFLIPNQIIDGGVVGVAIMAQHLTGLPVGLFIWGLNLPFLWVGYKQIGKTFAITTLGSVTLMSAFVSLLHGGPLLTDDLLLAAVFGGAVLGLGVGVIIRNGGSLDGTEMVAIMATRRTPFSVGEIVLVFNIFIFGAAAFVFNWERALYSLLTYFVAMKMIDLAMEGFDKSKAALIVCEQPDEVRDAIIARMGRGVTEIEAKGGYTGAARPVLYTVITRLELAKLKSIVLEIDPDAFVAIQDVHEVLGGRYRKKAIH
jgi:uncharacterized membrane-anchored protein YitT (DUF2179 family)